MADSTNLAEYRLGPVLGARRDGQAGASSTRDLVMTVLGEFVLPSGGSAWTQTLVAALEHLGVRDKSTRQALARMEGRGWLSRERVGRQTRWLLTDQATVLLTQGAERIYGFGRDDRPWDGTWVVLLASVPERDRAARYRMGQGLNWAGFGSIANGVWISPWADQEVAAVSLIGQLGVQATSFVAQVGQLGSGEELAQQAWDLPVLHAAYEEFLVGSSMAGSHPVAALTGLVHAWRRFPFLDPDLPSEVLPHDWRGRTAADRFAELRAELLTPGRTWWSDTEASNS